MMGSNHGINLRRYETTEQNEANNEELWKKCGKCVEIYGHIWKYVEICGNMWKYVEICGKRKKPAEKMIRKYAEYGPAPKMLMLSGSDLILKVNGTQLSHPATW